jgi:hypothetical protein
MNTSIGPGIGKKVGRVGHRVSKVSSSKASFFALKVVAQAYHGCTVGPVLAKSWAMEASISTMAKGLSK